MRLYALVALLSVLPLIVCAYLVAGDFRAHEQFAHGHADHRRTDLDGDAGRRTVQLCDFGEQRVVPVQRREQQCDGHGGHWL